MSKANFIVFLGPQGSGKGTQAQLLSEFLKLPSVSTGDMFRREIAESTELGAMISTYVNQGLLVPDDITTGVVAMRLKQADVKNGVILDGYPRNLNQAQALAEITKVDHVFFIDISDDEAVGRIHGRIVCNCGLSYHLKFNPPKQNMICDACGKKLYHRRDDDAELALRKRLEIYHREIKQLLDFYQEQNVLRQIDGSGNINEVAGLIKQALI